MPLHSGPITTLCFDDTHIITGSSDKLVKITDLRNGAVIDEILFERGVTGLSFDAWKILISDGGRDVNCYSRTSGSLLKFPQEDDEVCDEVSGKGYHTKPVRCVKIVNEWGVSGGMDGIVNVFEM